jgi:hypothetical protein
MPQIEIPSFSPNRVQTPKACSSKKYWILCINKTKIAKKR